MCSQIVDPVGSCFQIKTHNPVILLGKALLKKIIASALYYSGGLALYRALFVRNKAMVLMYHRILPSGERRMPPVQPGMYVTVETFRRQIQFLKTHFTVVSLGELVRRVAEGRNVHRCCVVTFDDGWLDNVEHGYPVLEQYSVPATIFLAAAYVGTKRWFWPEELSWCLAKLHNGAVKIGDLPLVLRKELGRVGLGTPSSLEESIEWAVRTLKKKPPEQRMEFIRQLKEECGLRKHCNRLLMNWHEVRELGKSGLIEFGSHTMNHVLLDQLQVTDAQGEIDISREVIERKSSRKCMFFAYPNGNYNERTLSLVGTEGFTAALTTKRGYVAPDSPLLQLPRIAVHEDVSSSRPLFLWRLVIR